MSPVRRNVLRGVACILLFSGALPPAFAAQTSAPAGVEAGPEERRFRRRGKIAEPPERVLPPIEETAPPYLEPPFGPTVTQFAVRAIHVEGSVLVPPEEARRLVSPYEGRTLTLADLQRLAQELTRWLRGHGYLTSRVYIPPQDITEGTVTLQVLEGRIGAIRMEGARYSAPPMLAHRMRTRSGDLLRYTVLQEDLGRLGANPDRRVMAVLVPGTTTGTTDVVVRLEERLPFHIGYFMHNAGTKLTGRVRQGLVVGHNNLTGHDDQLVLRTEFSNRSDFFGVMANYLMPIGAGGDTLGLDVSHADIELGRHFRQNRVIGKATALGLTWAHPLWQAAQWELEWVTGVNWNRVRSRETGIERGKDDLRVLRVGPNLLEQDALGRSIVTTEVDIGFDRLLGGSHKLDSASSRAQTGGQFTHVNLAAGRLQHLWRGLELLLRGTVQLTDRRLPPSEAIRLGGEDTVRGYPEGEILGDYGYVGTAEVRLPVRLPVGKPESKFELVGFADGGAAFLRKPVGGEEEHKRLIGVGCGFRWSLTSYTSALVDIGWPVGNDSSEGNEPRLYYAFNAGF